MKSKIIKITTTVLGITLIIMVSAIWVWDQNEKMVFYIQNPETEDYLTLIIRSSPSTDFNWIVLGKNSRFNPFPGSQYILTKGEMSIGYEGEKWILKNCIDQESTFNDKPKNVTGCSFESIPEEKILYKPYELIEQNGL